MRTVPVIVILMVLMPSLGLAGNISGKVSLSGDRTQAHVLVYLEDVKGKFPLLSKKPEITQRNQTFYPPVLPVQKGSTVQFPNEDDVFHSAFSFSKSNPFDLGVYGSGNDQEVKMKKNGLVEVFCNIHDNMFAYIHVMDHPFHALTDEKGAYKIMNVPDGTYSIKAWANPSSESKKKVTVSGGNISKVYFSLGEREVSLR